MIVDIVVRYGLLLIVGVDGIDPVVLVVDVDDDGGGGEDDTYGEEDPCIRVLTTSRGNVTIHPAIPATPPATKSAGHESVLISVSTSDIRDEWSCGAEGMEDRWERRRQVPSYFVCYLLLVSRLSK